MECERVVHVAHTYNDGVRSAVKESSRSPPQSPAASQAEFFDMSPRRTVEGTPPSAGPTDDDNADVFNTFAGSFAGAKSPGPFISAPNRGTNDDDRIDVTSQWIFERLASVSNLHWLVASSRSSSCVPRLGALIEALDSSLPQMSLQIR